MVSVRAMNLNYLLNMNWINNGNYGSIIKKQYIEWQRNSRKYCKFSDNIKIAISHKPHTNTNKGEVNKLLASAFCISHFYKNQRLFKISWFRLTENVWLIPLLLRLGDDNIWKLWDDIIIGRLFFIIVNWLGSYFFLSWFAIWIIYIKNQYAGE